MNLPDIFKVKAFWEALSYLVAGLLGLGFLFGWVPAAWVIGPAALLSLFLTVLKWLNIEPELRFLALVRELESLRTEMKAYLHSVVSTKKSVKK